jgi:EAL domain-containing protein (putative c-di-GMP-specific phosphodiesterase class I)
VEVVEQVLRGTELRAEQLVIDVTEATLLGHGEEVVRSQLLALRDRGVRIALDDFGSGYGSLHKLRRYPVTVVKVDPLFIDRLLEESEERSFVEALVRFGLGLGMEVVAEGVERPEQAEALRRIGCPYAQGNYFSEPLGELQLLEFLEQRGELVATAVG